MSPFRAYIDEVGNHDLVHVEEPNQRFLSLTGVILEAGYTRAVLQPEMEALKRRYFTEDPDEPVVLHRKEIVNKLGPFHVLRDPHVQRRFDADVVAALERWDYRVVTVVVDKKVHRDQYRIWHYQPYHYCLAVLLEIRAVLARCWCVGRRNGGKQGWHRGPKTRRFLPTPV